MDRSPHVLRTRWLACAGLMLLLAVQCGCVNLAANLLYAWKGNMIEAEYGGLAEHRVAVVCVSNISSYDPNSPANVLARRIEDHLRANVELIQVIDHQVVDDWIDRNNWDQTDFRAIGKGVDAEMVVAVNLQSFSTRDGPTLHKGRADVGISVYDMTQEGRRVFDRVPPQICFPATGGMHTTDVSDAQFKRQFIEVMAHRVAKHFYEYDSAEDFAQDTTLITR